MQDHQLTLGTFFEDNDESRMRRRYAEVVAEQQRNRDALQDQVDALRRQRHQVTFRQLMERGDDLDAAACFG